MSKLTACILLSFFLVTTVTSRIGWNLQCRFCRLSAAIILSEKSLRSHRATIWLVEHFCSVLNIDTPRVCHGMVEAVGYQLFHIISITNVTITSNDLCGMILGLRCAQSSLRLTNWTLHITDLNHPPRVPPPVFPPPNSSTSKILHLSDLHVQMDYSVGSATTCTEPVCCLASQAPRHGAPLARYWGEYSCDLAPWTLEAILASAAQTHTDIDYIILTGDYPAHDVWKQSRTKNINNIKLVASVLKKHFPNITVLPTIGNHESFPVNMFPDPSILGKDNPSWLYASVAKYFHHWLPYPEVQKTLSRAGYYSIIIKPGLRIIAVNSNFCNSANLWLLPRFSDPDNHLTWLYSELASAERNRERVHIISHIPPGTDSCLGGWSHQYNRVITRFRNTITGQFFGHTHFDEFEIFYANFNKTGDRREPISMGYIAPSLTTRDGLNPAYRVYITDSARENASHLIMDHATYMMDLEKANRKHHRKHKNETIYQIRKNSKSEIKVELEYTALYNLNLNNLSPLSWSRFVDSLAADRKLWDKFYWRYSRGGPAARRDCDADCRRRILCGLVTSDSLLGGHCPKITK